MSKVSSVSEQGTVQVDENEGTTEVDCGYRCVPLQRHREAVQGIYRFSSVWTQPGKYFALQTFFLYCI